MDAATKTAQFIDLLNQSQSRLFGYLYALVLNLDDAEDLYQQVAMVLWERFDQYEPGTDFGRWAIRVANLTVKNYVRRRRRSKVLFSEEVLERVMDSQASVDSATVASRTDALGKCLDRLPDDDRRLVEQCYGGGQKIQDVARQEGRTPDALYTALYRIRRALFHCIQRTVQAEVRS